MSCLLPKLFRHSSGYVFIYFVLLFLPFLFCGKYISFHVLHYCYFIYYFPLLCIFFDSFFCVCELRSTLEYFHREISCFETYLRSAFQYSLTSTIEHHKSTIETPNAEEISFLIGNQFYCPKFQVFMIFIRPPRH